MNIASVEQTQNKQYNQIQGSCLRTYKTHKVGQQPELSRAVPHPNPFFVYQDETAPGAIKSLIWLFCTTPAANWTRLRAGSDYEVPGVWGPENATINLAISISPTVWIIRTSFQLGFFNKIALPCRGYSSMVHAEGALAMVGLQLHKCKPRQGKLKIEIKKVLPHATCASSHVEQLRRRHPTVMPTTIVWCSCHNHHSVFIVHSFNYWNASSFIQPTYVLLIIAGFPRATPDLRWPCTCKLRFQQSLGCWMPWVLHTQLCSVVREVLWMLSDNQIIDTHIWSRPLLRILWKVVLIKH